MKRPTLLQALLRRLPGRTFHGPMPDQYNLDLVRLFQLARDEGRDNHGA